MSRTAPGVDIETFRADQDAALDHDRYPLWPVSRTARGMLDTNIMILRKWINPEELPAEMAISAITLAELSAGPHEVRPRGEQDPTTSTRSGPSDSMCSSALRAIRPCPLRCGGSPDLRRIAAAVIALGRKPRRRVAT